MSFAFLPLYTGDYRRDTQHLTPLRHGIYLLLLFHCWDTRGPVPLDEQESAGIANCRSADEIEALRYVLGRFFVRMEDGHYNKRMQREIERAENISHARSYAGKKGYEAKSQAIAKQVLGKCLASATTPTTTTTITPTTTTTPAPPSQPSVASEKAKSKPLRASHAKKPRDVPATVSQLVWTAYSNAYFARYGTEPVRNARVNGQIAHFVARVPKDEAPHIATHYVRSDKQRYVREAHSIGLLLNQAETIRTEWASGTTTGGQTYVNPFLKILEEQRNGKSE